MLTRLMKNNKHIASQQVRIAYLDGRRIRRAMAAGIRRVISGQEHLNKINVFPVADGDTGTNLALTMSAILSTLRGETSRRADTTLTNIADAALDGARGNSGAIIAQFLQGVSDSAEGMQRINAQQLAATIKSGERYARDALTKPREGTVITVMRDFADYLCQAVKVDQSIDLIGLFQSGLEHAKTSLANTPTQLEELRKAGVVDAGAEGFVRFLDGIMRFTTQGDVRQPLPEASDFELEQAEQVMAGEVHDLDYRYCTECMVTGDDIDRRRLREQLSALGGSLVLAGTKNKAKIHIHVNQPAEVFELAAKHGNVSGEKADDMHHQQELSHSKQHHVAITMDSAADWPDDELERLNVHMIPVRLHFGEESYLDKVSITLDEFFEKLDTHPHHPKTSQPSPGEFRRNFDFLASHHPSVLSINVTSGASGTYQSAVTAAERTQHKTVHVFDSKSASIGQALQVVHAAECAQRGMSVEQIIEAVTAARDATKVYGVLPSLAYTVRGGRVKPIVKKIADFFNLTPLFSLKSDAGKLSVQRMLLGRRNLPERLGRYVGGQVKRGQHYRVGIAYGRNPAHGKAVLAALTTAIEANGAAVEKHYMTRLGSALGVHAGPDCIVIGLQHRDPLEIPQNSVNQ